MTSSKKLKRQGQESVICGTATFEIVTTPIQVEPVQEQNTNVFVPELGEGTTKPILLVVGLVSLFAFFVYLALTSIS